MADTGKLLWSGEHWIAYLRRPGEDANSASVGIYHTRYSPAGEGNVALVNIPGQDGLQAIFTDNQDVLDFTMESVRAAAADDPFNDLDLPILLGNISREGDLRTSPSWVLESGETRLVVTWTSLITPVVLRDLLPNAEGKSVAFSVLIFADAGTIALNGRQVPGQPYIREGWRRLTGPDGPASSCCFALAETYTTRPRD